MKKYTHDQLTAKSVKWLLRAPSSNGAGCHVAADEMATGWRGERPDAIGFHRDQGSIVIETKTSRSDFLADRKKPHRLIGGVGDYRYFLAPPDLIKIDELPEKWGLMTITKRGAIQCIHGLHSLSTGQQYGCRDEWRHEVNRERECFVLVSMLMRFNDIDGAQDVIGLKRQIFRLQSKCGDDRDTIRKLQRELSLERYNNKRGITKAKL